MVKHISVFIKNSPRTVRGQSANSPRTVRGQSGVPRFPKPVLQLLSFSLYLVGNSHMLFLGSKKWIAIVTLSLFLDSFLKIMDSDSLGIHIDWVKTQVRFIITAFHKAQLNSSSTLPAEPVDSCGFFCELNPIQIREPMNPFTHH